MRRMSCYSESCRPCEVTCPQPVAESCNELCVQQCPNSRAVIFPPPAVVTVPGPILSSFLQESIVESSGPAWLGSSFSSRSPQGYEGSFGLGGYGGSLGYRSSWSYGGSLGLGGYGGYRSSLGLGGSSGCGASQGYDQAQICSLGLRGCGGSLGYGHSLNYGDELGYRGSLGYGSSGFGNCGRSYSSGFSSCGTGYYLPGVQRWGRSCCGSCRVF